MGCDDHAQLLYRSHHHHFPHHPFLFSVSSISFIFHFRVKTLSHSSPYLRDFNSLGPARVLLVSFALLWSLAELLHLCPFPPFCKAYLVASQGLFQPSFFILLLFLVSASLSGKSNHDNTLIKSFTVLSVSVLPVCVLQVFVVFFSHRFPPFSTFPEPFHRTSQHLKFRLDSSDPGAECSSDPCNLSLQSSPKLEIHDPAVAGSNSICGEGSLLQLVFGVFEFDPKDPFGSQP